MTGEMEALSDTASEVALIPRKTLGKRSGLGSKLGLQKRNSDATTTEQNKTQQPVPRWDPSWTAQYTAIANAK
ncbi:hypothetical protein BB8028_0002g04620 [Beauveria bassiana]|uniref:Uncharacterized protein n=1 Tax=Beauveria bassiana TaxID=176275 RepID=A0A2S7Y1X9_BEABA|nr:hypothetical protein BB8028_0002g04620 [Beauveria bassiana]